MKSYCYCLRIIIILLLRHIDRYFLTHPRPTRPPKRLTAIPDSYIEFVKTFRRDYWLHGERTNRRTRSSSTLSTQMSMVYIVNEIDYVANVSDLNSIANHCIITYGQVRIKRVRRIAAYHTPRKYFMIYRWHG